MAIAPAQAPLQPLMDNLESQTYETFERDPVKYKQYEKYLTVAFALAGAVGQALYLRPYVPDFDLHWLALTTLTLPAGACLTALIGEEITECKLGNGTSVLIFVNIASAIPASLAQTLGGASEGDNAAASLQPANSPPQLHTTHA